MKEIAITGANGVIGTVLREGLTPKYDITLLDLPETDVRDYQGLLNILRGKDVVVHLAWNSKKDNFKSEDVDPANFEMFHKVFKASLEAGVPRVLMASSVHADRFDNWDGQEKMSPSKAPNPDSPYGAEKVGMEAMGKYYASKGLEVVCIRFGGVGASGEPATEPSYERAVWLSHRDCVSLVESIIEAERVENNFIVVYGVSNNEGLAHDISNPFNWIPQDSASKLA